MTSADTTAQTLPMLLKALRLSHMQRQWQSLEAKAQQQGWSPSQFLFALCEYEHQQRYARRVQRYLKEAQLPAAKSLSNFDRRPSRNYFRLESGGAFRTSPVVLRSTKVKSSTKLRTALGCTEAKISCLSVPPAWAKLI